MDYVLREMDVDLFLTKIKKRFPDFVAGVITDNHGFLIASNVPKNFHIKESDLALSAIADERNIINDRNFTKVITDLNKSNNIKLFLLLQKSNKNINRFKTLRRIIEKQNLF